MSTLHDRHGFATTVLMPLALAFRSKPSDATATLYLERLSDIPLPVLERAVKHWIEHGKRYPRIADLREAADIAERSRVQKVLSLPPGPPSEEPTYACLRCEDTGWEYHQGKFGPAITIAEATKLRGDTVFVRPCECRATNPVLRARAEQAPRQYYQGEERRR